MIIIAKSRALLVVTLCVLAYESNVAEAESFKIETGEYGYLSEGQKQELQKKLSDIGVIKPEDHLDFVGHIPQQQNLAPGTIDVIKDKAGPLVCRELLDHFEETLCKKADTTVDPNCVAKFKQDYATQYNECNGITVTSN